MSDLNLLRQASRESLITFIERAMPLLIPDYVHFPYSDLIAAKIEDLIAPLKSGRLAINVPPRHGKSFILVAIAAWYLGRYPEREVLLMAHSQALAHDLAAKLGHLLKTSLFLELFPSFGLMPGRESASDFRTSSRGGFKAASFDTGVTGRGTDLLLIDDALSAHDASSNIARQTVRDTFDNMIVTRFNDPKTAAIVSMSHRLHEDDLTGHLVKKGCDHLVLPFQATQDEAFACLGILFTRKAGEVLQPGRWSMDQIQQLGLAPQVYLTQYQQMPTAMGSGILSARHFPTVETCPTAGQTIVSWDIASSTRDGASYSVALVFQVNDNVAYLKHILRERLAYSDLKKRALNLHFTFRPTIHLIESASLGIALASDLREAGANVIDIRVGGLSKEDRLNAVVNKIEAHFVRPTANTHHLEEFLNECSAFPHGAHNDMVDALTQFLNWLRDNGNGPTTTPVMRIINHRGRSHNSFVRKITGQR